MKKIYFIAVLTIYCLIAKSQLLTNYGALVYSSPSSLIKVQGSVLNKFGAIEHNGLIIIDSTLINNNSSTIKGNGVYNVYEHWINSGRFIKDTSTVNLDGSIQQIKGDSITNFYNLNLLGSGVKEQYINAIVSNKLNLNSNQLATLQDTMFLLNAANNSLLGNFTFGFEGFISNLDSGAFVRKTNSVNTYYYPMGSKQGFSRFRPVNIVPNNNNDNLYSLSFFNFNASINSYSITSKDSIICYLNDKFYHQINRIKGNSSADIEIGYLASVDNHFNSLSNWKTASTIWKDVLNVTEQALGFYNSNKRNAWANFSDTSYVLSNLKPASPSIITNSVVCGNYGLTVVTTSFNPNYSYDWGVNDGYFTVNDSTSYNASLTFTNSQNSYVTLNITDNLSGCSSLNTIMPILVTPKITAGFNVLSSKNTVGFPININDQSINSVSWFYDFGNSYNSNIQNPQTSFNLPNEYFITQIVYDQYGCSDTAIKSIFIDASIVIPEFFSPNGDGLNDYFEIKGISAFPNNKLEIFNRWGSLVYQKKGYNNDWEGKPNVSDATGNGLLPTGTYFVVFDYGIDFIKPYHGYVELNYYQY